MRHRHHRFRPRRRPARIGWGATGGGRTLEEIVQGTRNIDAPTVIRKALIGMLRVYRLVISPLFPPCCRYYPSCSAYAVQAIKLHGPLFGAWLALKRIGRCHPWAPGGHDPVPPQRNASASGDTTGERLS